MYWLFDGFEAWIQSFSILIIDAVNKWIYDYFRIIQVIIMLMILVYVFLISRNIYKNNLLKENKGIYVLNDILDSSDMNIILCDLKLDTFKIFTIIITALIVAQFINIYNIKLFYIFFNKCLSITLILLMGYYIFKYLIFERDLYISKASYIKLFHEYLVFVLICSSLLGVKYIVINSFGIYLSTVIRHYVQLQLKNKGEENKIELYGSRDMQIKDVHDAINRKSDENYAISINGQWGVGKTVFIESYMEKYKDEHFYIYIKPMITDSMQSLVSQISEQLNNIMIIHGFNLNQCKFIRKYFEKTIKIFEDKGKVSISEIFEITKYKDTYFDLKKNIQENIIELNKKTNKKIIFIIDDFDRIDEDKQELILHFIKEIVNFKKTITIFAFDYKKLDNNKKINYEYLEKFVVDQIFLSKMYYLSLISFNKQELFNDLQNKEVVNLANDISNMIESEELRMKQIGKRISSEYNSEANNTNGINPKDYKKLLKSQYDYIVNKLERLNNSRRVISFLHNINNTLKILERKSKSNPLNEYSKKLNVNRLIYIINYLKVFDNEIYTKILDYGSIDTFLDYEHKKNTFVNKDKSIELSDEDIKLSTQNWYIEQVFDFEFKQRKSIWNDNIEVIRREQAKIIKDLFIDYNLEGQKNNLLTKRQLRVKEVTDKKMNIDENEILNSLEIYKDAIVYCKADESIIGNFSDKCIDLVNEKKLSLLEYFNLLPKRAYDDENFIEVFTERFQDYKFEIKITASEYSRIKEKLVECKNIVMTENKHIIIFSVIILSDYDYTVEELKTSFEYFKNEKYLFDNINNKLNISSSINSFEDLLNKIKGSPEERKDNIYMSKLIIGLEDLIKKMNFIDNIITKLEESVEKEDKEKYVEYLSLEEQINYINKLARREDIDSKEARKFARVVYTIYSNIGNKSKDERYKEFEKLSDSVIEDLKSVNGIIKKKFKDNDFNTLALSVQVQYIYSNYIRIKKEDKTKTDQNNN